MVSDRAWGARGAGYETDVGTHATQVAAYRLLTSVWRDPPLLGKSDQAELVLYLGVCTMLWTGGGAGAVAGVE